MRDAADLYLSLKHPPVVFINDTPCGFVRHMECRDPDTAKQLWGSTSGCFEKPTLGKDPDWVLALFFLLKSCFHLSATMVQKSTSPQCCFRFYKRVGWIAHWQNLELQHVPQGSFL